MIERLIFILSTIEDQCITYLCALSTVESILYDSA